MDGVLVTGKKAKGQFYNVGGGGEKRNIDHAKEILRRLSFPETMIDYVSDRPSNELKYSLDCEKIRA
jgi:dTDP-glucose 4,6-dehydratase